MEADLLVITDGCRDGHQESCVDGWVWRVRGGVFRAGLHGVPHCIDPQPEPVGQHGLQLGQSAGAGVFDAANSGGRTESHRDGHRLIVLEEQRGEFRADAQPIVTAGSAYRLDGVIELSETFDVVTDGTPAHL